MRFIVKGIILLFNRFNAFRYSIPRMLFDAEIRFLTSVFLGSSVVLIYFFRANSRADGKDSPCPARFSTKPYRVPALQREFELSIQNH